MHQRDDVGLVAHVIVERHRRCPELGGDPLHRDRVESVGVRDPQRGAGDLLAGVARLAVGRWGQGPDGAVVVLSCHSYSIRIRYSYVVRIRCPR